MSDYYDNWDSYFDEMSQLEQLNTAYYPDDWGSYFDELAQLEQLNTSPSYSLTSEDRAALYGDAGYGQGMTGDQTARYDRALNLTGLKDLAKIAGSGGFTDLLKNLGTGAVNLATSKGGVAAIAALLSAMDRQKPSGGGTTMAYQGPRQYTRTVAPGASGTPIAQYAANGGMMHAYANGGHVQMEDGGFVMTKRAVDGAGGPRGIQQLVPGARMIRGPGTGTSDSIPAVINGRNGQTPARLSNGEAYVPRDVVQQAGGPKRMYALMNSLQRKT